jgi:hypothetical protein
MKSGIINTIESVPPKVTDVAMLIATGVGYTHDPSYVGISQLILEAEGRSNLAPRSRKAVPLS